MAKPIANDIAHSLYEALSLTLRNVRIAPSAPVGAVQFLGFADFQLHLLGHPFLVLIGNSIKTIEGRLHFDPNVEMGKGEKAGEKFNVWSPISPESRAVLTALLEACPETDEMREAAKKAFSPRAKTTNPF